MSVIAVVNRKGGSGKSTLATHLAAHFANLGVPVMLGDVDRQQSTQSWLRSRALRDLPRSAPIVGWAVDPKRVLRPPAGVHHVILDTPGGLRGFDLARVVAFADVILMPVCNSIFDRESAGDCFVELMTLPRVASGRCKVAAVGMRLDARTRAAETLQAWAQGLKLPFIGVLREAQAYVRCVEQGLTVFDLPEAQAQADLAQWSSIVAWLEPVLRTVRRPVLRGNASVVRPAVETVASASMEHTAELRFESRPQVVAPAMPATMSSRLTTATAAATAAAAAPATAPARTSSADSAVAARLRLHADVAAGARPLAPAVTPAAIEAPAVVATAPARAREPAAPASPGRAPALEIAAATPGLRLTNLFGWLTAPRFLHRNT